jgi:hypothetical protein
MTEEELAKTLADRIAAFYDFNSMELIILRVTKYNQTNFVNFTWWIIQRDQKANSKQKKLKLSFDCIEKIWFLLKHGKERQIEYFQDFLSIYLMEYWLERAQRVVQTLDDQKCFHCLGLGVSNSKYT